MVLIRENSCYSWEFKLTALIDSLIRYFLFLGRLDIGSGISERHAA